ncbi:MAG: OmpA family protein [Proteobacteria bacterium]|nr:OmpA family protein [Pseudomonadota bacterium]
MQGNAQQSGGKLQALVDLHAKQLADRDRQLSMLQGRLETAQSGYDSENASRLLAEKQLKMARDKDAKTEKADSASKEQLNLLSEQLKKSEVTIRQLKADLQARQSAGVLLNTNKVGLSEESGQQEIDKQTQSSFKVSNEWVIDGLRFKQGSADIEPDTTQNLNLLIEYMKQNSALSVQINGYTDSVGSVESNLRLSQARAESVASFLVGQGVDFYRIKAVGYGERRSLDDNGSERGRFHNRRVAVLFLN